MTLTLIVTVAVTVDCDCDYDCDSDCDCDCDCGSDCEAANMPLNSARAMQPLSAECKRQLCRKQLLKDASIQGQCLAQIKAPTFHPMLLFCLHGLRARNACMIETSKPSVPYILKCTTLHTHASRKSN